MAELAAFRKPSILVPYPNSFGDHQRFNAAEFVGKGAAEMVLQGDLVAGTLEPRILAWINDPDRLAYAESAMAEWDIPDSVDRILTLIGRTLKKGAFVS